MQAASSEQIRFDGRVVVVTGAGKGLGHACSLLLAARGAQLVVNNRRSTEGSADSAGDLAALICSRGGVAVADDSDVTSPSSADAIVALALETYGRIDALIHNAGIIENGAVGDLTDEDLARVYDVNTLSAFRLTRAALPVLRARGYGRIVFTTSTAALYGNAGLAAYSMAKGALLGLMRAVAAEEQPNGILANAVCPTAVTRMTEAFVQDPRMRAALAPELVAPVVAWLASDACTHGGHVILASGGLVRSAHVLQSAGADLRTSGAFGPEDVAAHAEAITAPTGLRAFPGAGAHFAALLDELQHAPVTDPE